MLRQDIFNQTITLLLAGGQGERLYPLTKDRSKPAVPFGGVYRIIDFTLSNCVNSNLRRIFVLTQYKSHSLDMHLKFCWNLFSTEMGEFLHNMPPQLRLSSKWYQGTADAVYQNTYVLEKHRPRYTMILSGDHVYSMDYSEMIAQHLESGAEITVAAVEMPVTEAKGQFGILEIDRRQNIVGFQEKPQQPKPIPGRAGMTLVNMGVYFFNTDILVRAVSEDSRRDSSHDFGKDIIPNSVGKKKICAFIFGEEEKGKARYWRDIGTIDSYFAASQDLISVSPQLNLYDESWPIRTQIRPYPPAKTLFNDEGRRGQALDSLVAGGVIISGGTVIRSVLGPTVRINSYAQVEDAILMDGVEVGRRAVIRRAIIDKGVVVPPDYVIGGDPEEDRKRFFISPEGIAVIPKGSALG